MVWLAGTVNRLTLVVVAGKVAAEHRRLSHLGHLHFVSACVHGLLLFGMDAGLLALQLTTLDAAIEGLLINRKWIAHWHALRSTTALVVILS